jgi:hypothetical protein
LADILSMKRLLGFKDFFPNEKPREKEFYASRVGKDTIEKTTPFFLSYFKKSGMPKMDDLLKDWFTFYNFDYTQSPSYWQIEAEYRRIRNFHNGEEHSILSVESLLNMFLWVRNVNIAEGIENQDASATLPYLELILLFNDEVLLNYAKAAASVSQFKDERQVQRVILAEAFSQHDLVNIDYAQLLYTQVYKKAKLLVFMESNREYVDLLSHLIKEFGCTSKDEFLRAIGGAVILSLNSPVPSWTELSIEKTEDKNKSAAILNNLTLTDLETQNIDQDDYLSLRSRPFQRIEEFKYRVVFDLFLIKKLYNGLIFKFSSYDKDFLGRIREAFSEGVLLYEILNSVLSQNDSILITGNKFKQAALEREPDAYYRNRDQILLFESKDFFMRGEYKLSYDFEIIERELKKEGRLEKAVSQLVRNIERCLLLEVPFDNGYDPNSTKIYPVIVVHDSLYSAPALNYWVNYWFVDKLELSKSKQEFNKIDFKNVVPITIVEIDTLILYENHFKNHEINLYDLIEQYHQYVRFDLGGKLPPEAIEEHALRSAISFSEFVRSLAHKLNLEIDFNVVNGLLGQYGIT